MKPVLSSNQDVLRLIEEGCRARLISQIVGSPESYPTNEFTSYFHAPTKEKEPLCLLSSHGKRRVQPRKAVTIPAYPSVIQTLRWSPDVEKTSATDSQTKVTEDKPNFNCKCDTCTEKKCPSKASLAQNLKQNVFKDNIMTFSDQFTMTPRLNDVSCGVCIPGLSTPKSSKVYVAVRDTETDSFCPKSVPRYPIPILKRSESKSRNCQHGYCGHATGHVPGGIRQEAVRDTDMTVEEDYCEPIKPKSYKSFFKFKKKTSFETDSSPANNGSRKIIYNEGISDDVANLIPPATIPPPMCVDRESSKVSVKNEPEIVGIPYSHNSESRYHQHCKQSDIRPHYYTSEYDDVRHLVESPVIVRKTVTTKLPVIQYKPQRIALPRRVLTSELDIDSFVERSRPTPSPPPACRRNRSRRFF